MKYIRKNCSLTPVSRPRFPYVVVTKSGYQNASAFPTINGSNIIQLEVNPRLCRGTHNGSIFATVDIFPFPPP